MDKDEYEDRMRDLEEMDVEQSACAVHNDGLVPNGDPRVEAIIRRAIGGNGYHSQLLAAYYQPD